MKKLLFILICSCLGACATNSPMTGRPIPERNDRSSGSQLVKGDFDRMADVEYSENRQSLRTLMLKLYKRNPHELAKSTSEAVSYTHLDVYKRQSTHRVTGNQKNIELGPTEFRLLHFFMTNAERVHTRSQLLDKVWGDRVFVEDRTVDVHIRRLRNALVVSGHEDLIQTVRGAGYRFSEKKD